MVNTNGMAGDEIGGMYARMANRVETFADQSERFYNIISWLVNKQVVNGSVLTLERLQLMENHEIKIKDGEPPDVPAAFVALCDERVAKLLETGKNGKEAKTDQDPLAVPPDAEQPSPTEASDGN